jgi:PAS domain S-box-containing protein
MRKKILIVEDEPIIAEDLRLTLEGIGYSVVGTFARGRDALQAARTLAPDAVIMDILLKNGDDGIEYTRQIQRECDVPIVYLTAHMDRVTFDRAQETYPYGYLVKPVGASELFSSIETAIHRHTLEKKLKESEHRYRLLSELVSDGASSVRIDPDGSFHLEWSTNYFREKLGYGRGELTSLESWARAIHREDLPLFFRSIDLLRNGEPVSGDFRVLAKSGALHWLHATVYPEWNESQQRLCRVITALQDITERKSAEEALRINEERLRLIADNMQDIICQVDREGGIVYLSPSFRQLTGFDPGEKLGTHIFDGIHPDDVSIVMDAVREAMGNQQAGRVQYRYQHKEGHYLLFDARGSLLMGEGNEIMGAVFVARDITLRTKHAPKIDAHYTP